MHLPSNVSVFSFPNQILHQPHTLPLVRLAILSWVESFLYASGKVVWLNWLAPTVKQRCERHKVISFVLEAFFRCPSVCLPLRRMKFQD